jgi:hypothetical protein
MYPAMTSIAKAKRALDLSHMSDEPTRRRLAEAQVLATIAVADAARSKRLWSRKTSSSFYLNAWREFEHSQTARDEENALLMLSEAQVLATLALAEGMGGSA